MPVYLFATLDTKGDEAALVRDELAARGVPVCMVDCGCLGPPRVVPDLDRSHIFQAAGGDPQHPPADRGAAVELAARGAAQLAAEHFAAGRIDGLLGLGGSAGTTIATAAMRALPLGVPKVMVSTLASGQVRQYVGTKDIFMLHAVVDLSGINRISRAVLRNAAAAMAGMVQQRAAGAAAEQHREKPLVAATMFGVTTPCVEHARRILEQAGYEVLVFHATGIGGQTMESLVADGLLAGVLDLTTTELADELVGGVLSAGPQRLTAAARVGIPQVVSVGALDMVNFHAPDTVPERFAGRRFHQHNPTVTLMRTTPEENARLGAEMAAKLRTARGPTAVLFPRGGVSALDAPRQPFDDPQARDALLCALRAGLRDAPPHVELLEMEHHINDPAFAQRAAEKLLAYLAHSGVRGP
jgi:uncharacterized protein (UPF0261 family)